MDWKFVPKEQDAADVDDAKKGERKQVKKTKNEEIEAAKEANEPPKLEETYDIWYLVRLDRSVSPAPAGWLFGRQVELQVPSDIVFFQQNNKNSYWQRFDTDSANKGIPAKRLPLRALGVLSRIMRSRPWMASSPILTAYWCWPSINTARNTTRLRTSGEVWGLMPLKMEGTGDSKSFTMKLRRPDSKDMEDRRLSLPGTKPGQDHPAEDIAVLT